MKDYLDDFVCDVTCEEFYNEDDMYWGDQEEQAHAGGDLEIPAQMSAWERNAHHASDVYGVYVDWAERFYICPECEEPVYECDWREHELEEFFCPICEYDESEDE